MAGRDDDREARLRASRELGKAKRAMQAIRSLYVATAILAGVMLALGLLADAGPVFIGTYAVVFVAALFGIRGVNTEPFLWTLGAAVFWTLDVAARLALGTARSSGMWFFVICAWALGCWMMLPSTRRVRELIRKHPDLWIARRMPGRGERP